MNIKLLATVALAVGVGVGLTACSAPVEEQTPSAPAPVVEAEETVSEPVDTFIDFAKTAEPVHDGVPVVCETDGEGQEATGVRILTTNSDDAYAVKGETSYFVMECSYPATDEVMAAIEELNASQ